VITGIIIVIIRVISNITIFIPFIILIRLFIIGFESSLSLVLTLRSEASLCLTHLVEFCILVFTIILKDLILLLLHVLILQLFDDLFLLGPALTILQVVHVQLVLQVVNIGVLLNIGAVETLQLRLKPLVLFLELWLDIFNALQSLISAF